MPSVRHVLAASLALVGTLALARADVVECRVQAPPESSDPASLYSRIAAAQQALPGVVKGRAESLRLLSNALAGQLGGLSVAATPAAGEWLVTIDGQVRLQELIAALDRSCLEFGPPTVVVEPERPASEQDRQACASVMTELSRLGFQAIDGERTRSVRRDAADSAVLRGLEKSYARSFVDRPEADYILRLGVRVRVGEESAYGISMAAVDATVSQTVTRAGTSDALTVRPVSATARSQSDKSAERAALEWALRDAVAAAAAAISHDWIQALEGRRPWSLEVVGSDAHFVTLLTDKYPPLRLREHNPGVRSLLDGDASSVQSAAATAGASRIELRRPGYIRVTSARSWSGWWTAVLAAGLCLALAAAAWRAFRRLQHAVRSGAP